MWIWAQHNDNDHFDSLSRGNISKPFDYAHILIANCKANTNEAADNRLEY